MDLQCPHSSQRRIQAKVFCNGSEISKYSCLYDRNNHVYIESCNRPPDFVRLGKRYVIIGSRTDSNCYSERYQPFIFWSNETSDCVYQKSLCSEIGQTIYDRRSTREDSTCSCDYAKGYGFVTQPKNIKYCIPSKEDCSCYLVQCADNNTLSSDYKCRPGLKNENNSAENMDTRVIKPIISDEDDGMVVDGRPMIIILAICMLTICYIVIAFIFIRQRHLEEIHIEIDKDEWENQKKEKTLTLEKEECIPDNIRGQRQLEERVTENDKVMRKYQKKIKALTVEKEECIPHNIQEQHQDILNDWTKNVNMFVSTRASERVFNRIKWEQSVTVTGNPGVGKTATMRYVALKMKDEGYTVVPTNSPKDIINFSEEGKKMLFVVDDACGNYTVNPHLIDK